MNEKTTGELTKILSSAHTKADLIRYTRQYAFADSSLSFPALFQCLLEQKGLSKSEVIKNSFLDRTYAYQILSGARVPGRNKILALGISAQFSLKEIQKLLEYAKAGGLYSRSSRDAIIIYGIEHHMDLLRINELLDENGEELVE